MNSKYFISVLSGALLLLIAGAAAAQDASGDREVYVDRTRVDRYLDVDIWADHSDGDYYIGDKIELDFRTNRDAFVAVYSIDTRGRVNLLFPAYEGADNFVYGGVTYRLPGPNDDFDLVVGGPEGAENIQIIASQERFPIPDWYNVSGIICDWDSRNDFMDYLNNDYFVKYEGQRFAFDRTAIYVNEWEPDYYRPVYYPQYPSWTVCGNVYLDYPWGATIYIDGVYWGCTPLYIPRLYVGWHTFTVYDPWGYCWENDVHVTHYHTVVLDRGIVDPRPGVASKYKEVRHVGYRDPVSSGYPDFKSKLGASVDQGRIRGSATDLAGGPAATGGAIVAAKHYVRGSSGVVKTERGIQTTGLVPEPGSKRVRSGMSSGSGSSTRTVTRDDEGRGAYDKRSDYDAGYGQRSQEPRSTGSANRDEGSSSGYYQKKSGESQRTKTEVGRSTGSTKRDAPADRPAIKKSDVGPTPKPSSSGSQVGGNKSGAPKERSSGGGSKKR